jgi:hypothetical protein
MTEPEDTPETLLFSSNVGMADRPRRRQHPLSSVRYPGQQNNKLRTFIPLANLPSERPLLVGEVSVMFCG